MTPDEVRTKLLQYMVANAEDWDFDNDWIEPEGTKLVVEALQTSSMVQTLYLSGNNLEPDGIRALAEALRTNCTLQVVMVNSNAIGLEGVKALVEALRTNTTLHTMSLNGNNLGPDGVKVLAETLQTNARLREVFLGNNAIGDEGLEALAAALKTNTVLQEIDISNNAIGDDGVQELRKALEHNETLHTIHLGDNVISDALRAEIRQLLGRNRVAAALRRLIEEPGTEMLDLSSEGMGDSGARAVAAMLRTNTGLRAVDLRWNNIGPDGAKALASALRTNGTLQVLYLDRNALGNDGARALRNALKDNKTLQRIDLDGNGISGRLCAEIRQLMALRRVAAALWRLIEEPGIETLHLYGEGMGESGARAVAAMLRTNTGLRAVDLRWNNIGPDGAKALVRALRTNRTLQVLKLDGNAIGDDGVRALRNTLDHNKTLQRIDLDDNSISDTLRADVRRLLAPRRVAAALQQLNEKPDTEELDLHGVGMGDSEAQAIAAMLRMNAGLRSVDLSGNFIGPEGAKAMAEALRMNSTLQVVDLDGNFIGPDGAKALAEALRNNATLQTMKLNDTDIDDVGARALCEALPDNETLQCIDLTGNGIDWALLGCLRELLDRNCRLAMERVDVVTEALDHLIKNPTIQELCLSGRGAGDEGARAVAEALRTRTGLLRVYLKGSQIGPAGARTLAEMLQNTTTLRELYLDDNRIGDAGARALLGALQHNESLHVLSLDGNGIGGALLGRLRELLVRNSRLAGAESVLTLHRLLRRAVELRRRAASKAAAVPADFEALLRTLRAFPPAVAAEARQELVEGLEQRLAEALARLSAAQLAVRKAAATLSPVVNDDAVETALQAVTVERDSCRAAAWHDLTDCIAELLHAAVGRQGGADSATIQQRRAEVQRWIEEVEAALAPINQTLKVERSPLGCGSTAPVAGQLINIPQVLRAFDTWQEECSLKAHTLATDEALRAVTTALVQTRLLTPPADDAEEAECLAALMRTAEAGLTAELVAWETRDPATSFPARLLMEGARQLITGLQEEMHFLEAAERHVAGWEAQAAELHMVMDIAARKVDVVRQWRTTQKQVRVSRLTAEMLDKQYELARETEALTLELATQREAAQHAVGVARAAMQVATAELVRAAADHPELTCYLGRGLPEPLLPLWESDRRVDDFEDLQPVVPSRNRVYRGRLAGQRVVLKGFSMPVGGLHTCLREALRLVRAAHPHVVEVTALFQDPNTHTFYLQMPDYTEGPLDHWAITHQPDVPAMRRALQQAFDGVAHLHCLGIIHSDLKPANLLVAGNGTVRVGDLDVSVDCATRVSPQYASTVLVGYTVGYAAPELLLLQMGATKASDAYSLGAVVREVGLKVASAAGREAAELVQAMCADNPAARPAVAAAMQHAFFLPAVAWERVERRGCGMFASELCDYGEAPVALARGVQCAGVRGGERHFVCDECLARHVATFLASDLRTLRATEGHIRCPQCQLGGGQEGLGASSPAYSDAELARHLPPEIFEPYVVLRLRLTEQQLAEHFDAALKAAVEAEREQLLRMDERQRRVRQARNHVVEEILNLRCPRCGQVFVDFVNCCALTCSRCPCAFCAWCGQDCGVDAHAHVVHCAENPPGTGGVFVEPDVWHEQQRQRRRHLVEAYLTTLDAETQQAVREELRRDIEGL
eukprot:EG_transcript_262